MINVFFISTYFCSLFSSLPLATMLQGFFLEMYLITNSWDAYSEVTEILT